MSNVRSSAHRLSRREVLGLGATAAGAALLYRSGALAAQPAAGVIRRTLANGLVVLIDERRTAESVALHLSARAGARDDGRVAPAIASGRLNARGLSGSLHPRDHMPPPGGIPVAYSPGVASERVDNGPLPRGFHAGRPALG